MEIAEEILKEVYYEIGSPCKFSFDKTAWKEIALDAMRRYRAEFLNNLLKCENCGGGIKLTLFNIEDKPCKCKNKE